MVQKIGQAKSVYTGARSTILDWSYTCYNSNTSGCPTAVVAPPVTSRTAYDIPNFSSLSSYSSYAYDTYGNLTSETDYDYAASGNQMLKSTVISYDTSQTLCTGAHNVCNAPLSVQVTGNTGSSYTIYTYDEGGVTVGKVTTLQRSKPGSQSGPFLTWKYYYNTGGTLSSSTDPSLTGSTYSYPNATTTCNYAFPTSITVGGLTTSYGYDCGGAVLGSVTDPNNATTSTQYNDPYFWRPASITDPVTTTIYSYLSPTQFESTMTFNSNNSVSDNLAELDGFGRVILRQAREGPGSGTYDTVQYNYDSNGRQNETIGPASSGEWGSVTQPWVTTTFDALNRPSLVTGLPDLLYHSVC